MPEAAQRVLREADVSVEEIDLLIPHQANLRIIEAVGDRLGMYRERRFISMLTNTVTPLQQRSS